MEQVQRFSTFDSQQKKRFCLACVRSVMLCGNETWPVKEEDVISLERNDVNMAR